MILRRALALLLLGAAPAPLILAAETTATRPAQAPAPVETVVQSDQFEMVSSAKETTFTYRGNVRRRPT